MSLGDRFSDSKGPRGHFAGHGTAQDQARPFKTSFHTHEHGSETVGVPPFPPYAIVE